MTTRPRYGKGARAVKARDGRRIVVLGCSGSGKTYLVRRLIADEVRAGSHAVVLDPEAEYGGDLEGFVTIDGLGELSAAARALREDPPVGEERVLWVFQPRRLSDLAVASGVAWALAERLLRPLLIVAEECHLYARDHRIPAGLENAATRGRKRGLTLLAVSQSPAQVPKLFLSQRPEIHAFHVSEPNAVRYLAGFGVPEEVRTLPMWHRLVVRQPDPPRRIGPI